MDFRITPHAGQGPPEDAVELLWQCLDAHPHENVSFTKAELKLIRASTIEDAPIAMTVDEREAIGRRAVLDIVRELCEETPALSSDWFAVGPDR